MQAGAMIMGDNWNTPIDSVRGMYRARRAAALAGVPLRTLHHWAHDDIYRPSVSPDPRDYLWSWGDLLALRAMDWLRRKKDDPVLPKVSMRTIRAALAELEKDGLPRHKLRELAVSSDGSLFFHRPDGQTIRADASRQEAMPSALNLVAAYNDRGPDLLEPRPLLRILPGKLHGEPHIAHTRISTAVLYELHREGYNDEQIRRMYPDLSADALRQAIDLEQSLITAA
jgi:uncharacterized protein (DUF433 family)